MCPHSRSLFCYVTPLIGKYEHITFNMQHLSFGVGSHVQLMCVHKGLASEFELIRFDMIF